MILKSICFHHALSMVKAINYQGLCQADGNCMISYDWGLRPIIWEQSINHCTTCISHAAQYQYCQTEHYGCTSNEVGFSCFDNKMSVNPIAPWIANNNFIHTHDPNDNSLITFNVLPEVIYNTNTEPVLIQSDVFCTEIATKRLLSGPDIQSVNSCNNLCDSNPLCVAFSVFKVNFNQRCDLYSSIDCTFVSYPDPTYNRDYYRPKKANCPASSCWIESSQWNNYGKYYNANYFFERVSGDYFSLQYKKNVPFYLNVRLYCFNGFHHVYSEYFEAKVECNTQSTVLSQTLTIVLQDEIRDNIAPYVQFTDFVHTPTTSKTCEITYSISNIVPASSYTGTLSLKDGNWGYSGIYRHYLSDWQSPLGTFSFDVTGQANGGSPPITQSFTMTTKCGPKSGFVITSTFNEIQEAQIQIQPRPPGFMFPQFSTFSIHCPIIEYKIIKSDGTDTEHALFSTPSNIISSTIIDGNVYASLLDAQYDVFGDVEFNIIVKVEGGYESTFPSNLQLINPGRMGWQATFDFLIAQGGTMPTLAELRQMIAEKAGKSTWLQSEHVGNWAGSIAIGNIWIPCGQPGDKDWVQIGDHTSHYPGKSYLESYDKFPDWSEDITLYPSFTNTVIKMTTKYIYKIKCLSPQSIVVPALQIYNIDRRLFNTYNEITLPSFIQSTECPIISYTLSMSADPVIQDPDPLILKFKDVCFEVPCNTIEILTGDDSSLLFPFQIDFYVHLLSKDNTQIFSSSPQIQIIVNCGVTSALLSDPLSIVIQGDIRPLPEVPFIEFADFESTYNQCPITYILTGNPVFETTIALNGVNNRVSFQSTESNTIGTFSFTVTGQVSGGVQHVKLFTITSQCGPSSGFVNFPTIVNPQVYLMGNAIQQFVIPEFVSLVIPCPIIQYSTVLSTETSTLNPIISSEFKQASNFISTLANNQFNLELVDVNSIVDVQFRIFIVFLGDSKMNFPVDLLGFYEFQAFCVSSQNSIIEPPNLQKTFDFHRSNNGQWKSIILPEFQTQSEHCKVQIFELSQDIGQIIPPNLSRIRQPNGCIQPCQEIEVIVGDLSIKPFNHKFWVHLTAKDQSAQFQFEITVNVFCGEEKFLNSIEPSQMVYSSGILPVNHDFMSFSDSENQITEKLNSTIFDHFKTDLSYCPITNFQLIDELGNDLLNQNQELSLIDNDWDQDDITFTFNPKFEIIRSQIFTQNLFLKGTTQGGISKTIELVFGVCGFEKLSATKEAQIWDKKNEKWANKIEYITRWKSNEVETKKWKDILKWFKYDKGEFGFDACQNIEMKLYKDDIQTKEQNFDDKYVQLDTPSLIESAERSIGSQDIRIYKSQSLKFSTLYLRMKTKGNVEVVIDLNFEICGKEQVTLKIQNDIIEFETVQRQYLRIKKEDYFNKFVSTSQINCPASNFTLHSIESTLTNQIDYTDSIFALQKESFDILVFSKINGTQEVMITPIGHAKAQSLRLIVTINLNEQPQEIIRNHFQSNEISTLTNLMQ